MTIGFKTGPRNWDLAKKIVQEESATMCEVWFQVEKAPEYEEMLGWLTGHGVSIGLHHWGLAPGNCKTNLMTNNEAVRAETLRQMRATIDIGAKIHCAYVNIHPGARSLEQINFDTNTQSLVPDSATPDAEARELLLEGAAALSVYAQEHGVVLTIETLPGAENIHYEERQGWFDPGSATLEDIEAVATAGHFIANDITHTAGQLARTNPDPAAMWPALIDFTKRVLPQARLVHINTVRPPFDGTDSHNGILPSDWEAGAWPSREQLKAFLALFAERDDVFIIPEPQHDMAGNFRALRDLAAEIAA